MQVMQFGSSTAARFKPVWLGGLVAQKSEESPEAKSTAINLPYANFAADGYGARRSPAQVSPVRVSGLANCGPRRTQAEWERELRRYIGLKDWLIGYRSQSCKCGLCSFPLRCCNVCGTDASVAWFARRARLNTVNWTDDADSGQRWGYAPQRTELTFEPYGFWQKMTEDHWAFGVPAAHDVTPDDACDPPGITEMAWPCNFPACEPEPAFRFYRRTPSGWPQSYCVGYWSAAGWKRGHIDGEMSMLVEGDVSPLIRWAFKNFTNLTVTICTPYGEECSFSVDTLVGEPQYLLVDPRFGAEARYCPLDDDLCLAQPGGAYATIAQEGTPVPFSAMTCAMPGQLWPGLNIVRFSGFRLPGHLFHWSYDLVERVI